MAEGPETKETKETPIKVVDRRWWARADAGQSEADAEADVRKPTYVEDLERQLADVTAQLQRVLTDRQRAQTEFDDVRARLRREVAKDVERSRRALLAELLDVIDNLDRAMAAGRESSTMPDGAGESTPTATSEAFSSLLRGVALVRDQFLAKLEQFGVTRLDSLGQPFEAGRHEALSTTAVADPLQDGVVVAVVKEGYMAGNELLRPASVVVGRCDETEGA
jgi:molecular chaperone GrpE